MAKKSKRSRNPELQKKYQGDYIIPVMGPTGAGKSSFINQLFGKDVQVVKVGHSLDSCTIDLEPIEVPADLTQQHLPLWDSASSNPAKKLIIVDTPGFDDTSADDSEILKRIADWLADTYGEKTRLTGVIYLQDICQRRVTGATKRNFEVFDKLCGEDACRSVVLGTTQWTRIPKTEREMAKSREQELRDKFWKDMVGKGSRVMRVDDKNTSPWNLVETVLCKGESPMLKIQEELTVMDKSLPQTDAALVLRRRIEELIKSLKDAGASKEEVRALAKEVEALKEKMGLFRRFLKLFG